MAETKEILDPGKPSEEGATPAAVQPVGITAEGNTQGPVSPVPSATVVEDRPSNGESVPAHPPAPGPPAEPTSIRLDASDSSTEPSAPVDAPSAEPTLDMKQAREPEGPPQAFDPRGENTTPGALSRVEPARVDSKDGDHSRKAGAPHDDGSPRVGQRWTFRDFLPLAEILLGGLIVAAFIFWQEQTRARTDRTIAELQRMDDGPLLEARRYLDSTGCYEDRTRCTDIAWTEEPAWTHCRVMVNHMETLRTYSNLCLLDETLLARESGTLLDGIGKALAPCVAKRRSMPGRQDAWASEGLYSPGEHPVFNGVTQSWSVRIAPGHRGESGRSRVTEWLRCRPL